jgi:preprotein translocase subunit SecG
MATVLLIIHIMIALALIGVVLLQRSEGGALGIGGGGGGGFMTGRGAANLLTRVTAGLAAGFFATSLLLSLVATRSEGPRSILDVPASAPGGQPGQPGPQAPKPPSGAQMPQLEFKNLPGGQLPDEPKSGTQEPARVPQSK